MEKRLKRRPTDNSSGLLMRWPTMGMWRATRWSSVLKKQIDMFDKIKEEISEPIWSSKY